MFTFLVRISSFLFSRSWSQSVVVAFYKIHGPVLARHKFPLCPSEEISFSSLQVVFLYTSLFRLTKARICIFQNCRVLALLRSNPIFFHLVREHP